MALFLLARLKAGPFVGGCRTGKLFRRSGPPSLVAHLASLVQTNLLRPLDFRLFGETLSGTTQPVRLGNV
jgi:hypothetical protein